MFDVTDHYETLPQGYVNVVSVMNPFSDDHRAVARIPAGASIQDIFDLFVDDVGPDVRDHMSAFVDGDYIPPQWWCRVRPKAGATLLLKPVPGISAALAVLAPIAGQFVAGFVGTGIAAQLVSSAVAFGILAIGSALFGPSEPDAGPEAKKSFSITGSRNQVSAYSPVPVVLGTHRYTPPYGGFPYTRVFGNDQYLHIIVVWGYGPVGVEDIRIGNTPIGNFDGLQVWHDFEGTQTEVPLYPADTFQENLNILLDQNPTIRVTAPNTTRIELVVSAPQGLYTTYKGEFQNSAPVTIFSYYRALGSSEWITLSSFQGPNTKDFTRLPVAIDVPPGEYEVRVERSAPIPDNPDPNVQIFQDVFWTSLRSYNYAANPVQLPGVAKSAFIIKATDQLNGVVDQINGVVTTGVPIWNGAVWTGLVSSSNPAAIFRHVLTGPGTPRPVPLSNVDDVGLGEWYNFCLVNGCKFDAVIDSRRPMADLLRDIAAAGFASPAYIDDKWTVVIERPRSALIQHFTPRNTRNFQGAVLYPETPEALRIRFNNAEKNYLEDERVVFDEGFNEGNASLYQTIELPGQTDPDNVYKLGRHFLASQRLRPEVFTFEVDVEHLVATRGDLCRLTHDAAIIGQTSGRVKGFSGANVVLDQFVEFEAGTSYTIRSRNNLGFSVTHTFTAGTTQTTNQVPAGSLSGSVGAGDLFMFGLSDRESIEVLISNIEYLDDLAARVTCVPYSPEIYNAANVIPDYVSNLSDPQAASFVGPPPPIIDAVVTNEAALLGSGSSFIPRILVYPLPGSPKIAGNPYQTETQFYYARFRVAGSSDPYTYTSIVSADTIAIDLRPVQQGQSYEIGLRAIDGTGGVSQWTTRANVFVVGGGTAPPDVPAFSINVIGGTAQLSWSDLTVIDLSHYEIRYSPFTSGVSWSTSTVLISRVSAPSTSASVPARTGTYLIKAVDYQGNKSANATENVVSINVDQTLNLNVIQEYEESPAFAGLKVGTVVTSDGGPDFLTLDSTTQFDEQTGDFDDATGLFDAGELGSQLEGTYVFTSALDLGSVLSVFVRSSIDFDYFSYFDLFDDQIGLFDGRAGVFDGSSTSVDSVNARVQVSTTNEVVSGSTNWGPWQDLVSGNFSGRGFRFRAVLSSDDGATIPKVKSLGVQVDLPDRVEAENDIDFTGTTTVSFPTPFYVTSDPALGISLTGLGTGDYYTITNKTNAGFTVTVKDAAGVNLTTSTQLDYVARGF